MEQEIKNFEEKLQEVREEIKSKDFHIKSKSGILDKVMFDSEAVKEYLEIKSQELSDLKVDLVKGFDGEKSELEKEIDERAENFIHEMAYLTTVGKFEL